MGSENKGYLGTHLRMSIVTSTVVELPPQLYHFCKDSKMVIKPAVVFKLKRIFNWPWAFVVQTLGKRFYRIRNDAPRIRNSTLRNMNIA